MESENKIVLPEDVMVVRVRWGKNWEVWEEGELLWEYSEKYFLSHELQFAAKFKIM